MLAKVFRNRGQTRAMKKTRNMSMCVITLLLLVGPGVDAQQEESTKERQGAEELYKAGHMMALLGRYQEAIRLLERSLEVQPTAEAYTYLGWTYSHLNNHRRAIEHAQKAIRLDPDFGNPYNDMGVYLMTQGKEDEAIPYLEKAMRAKRYCCYQFPHYNMGRIYLKKKMYEKARREFQKALEIDPDYAPAAEALERLEESGIRGI